MRRATLLLPCLLGPLAPVAAQAADAPPPGLYEVDVVDDLQAGRLGAQLATDHHGEATLRSGGATVVAPSPPDGRMTQCVGDTRPGVPGAYLAPGLEISPIRWAPLGPGRWSVSFEVTQDPTAGAPAAAYAGVVASLPAADQAAARAQLARLGPLQAQQQAATAELRRTMEARLAGASAEEAAGIRAMLAALPGGGAQARVRHSVRMLYTRIADHCSE